MTDDNTAKIDKILAIVSGHEDRFSKIDERFKKIDETFMKMFKYMEDRFTATENRLDTKADKTDIDKIYIVLDRIEKRLEITEDERLVMGHQISRHDKWVHQLASKIGHKLT